MKEGSFNAVTRTVTGSMSTPIQHSVQARWRHWKHTRGTSMDSNHEGGDNRYYASRIGLGVGTGVFQWILLYSLPATREVAFHEYGIATAAIWPLFFTVMAFVSRPPSRGDANAE